MIVECAGQLRTDFVDETDNFSRLERRVSDFMNGELGGDAKQTSASISCIRALNFSSNCPRIPDPAITDERSSANTRLSCNDWG